MAVPPWIVSDGLWELLEPLLPRVERRFRYPGRKRLPDRRRCRGSYSSCTQGSRGGTCRSSSASAAARPATAASTSGSAPAFGSGCTRCCWRSCVPPARSNGHVRSLTPATCKRKRGLRDGPEPG